ncbi:MAG: DUF4838 domain-containing protein [Bacilli bacterium]|nr:DUF4838 domain-containing protein [Bacilli bacterium]
MKKNKILIIILIGVIILGVSASLILLLRDKEEEIIIPEDEFTDILLVDKGTTRYKIVVPIETPTNIRFVSNELIKFFKEATGVTLEVILDEGLEFNGEDYYLSIGQTKLLEGSDVVASYDELGLDGLRLVTSGNTVLMAGGSDTGAMYAVYEFLERTFNLEVYGEDEYYIDTDINSLYLKDFDVTEIPTFERRSVGLFPYSVNETFRNRMRQNLYNQGWIYWSHSHFKILPPDIYQSQHPDWYSPDGSQLCLSNDEMREEFTRVIIELIKNNKDSNYIMLGQEDINTFCSCPDCTEKIKTYKESGVMMHFVNQVADDVQAYIDENEPGRVMFLGTFGYHKTEEAPVKVNENNEYVPIDESVMPRDNVMVMVAPIRACNSHNYYADCNTDTERILKGWGVVAKDHMFTWVYNKIFAQYFLPLNNFSTLKQNYIILDEVGSQFVYHQGNKETQSASFQELKCYVQAKLMWDVSLNPEELAADFIKVYYKDAADKFMEYFQLMRFTHAIWEDAEDTHAYNSGSRSLNTFTNQHWTRDLLDKFDNLFEEMMAEIDYLKIEDPDLYEKLSFRINKERLTVDYLYLYFYLDEFTYEEATEKINHFEAICNQAGITVWREMYMSDATECLITSLVDSWRIQVQQFQ